MKGWGKWDFRLSTTSDWVFFIILYLLTGLELLCVFRLVGVSIAWQVNSNAQYKMKKEEKAGDVISSWRTILSEGGRADGGEGNTIFFFTCSLFAAHQL